jgi:hypothetical protein
VRFRRTIRRSLRAKSFSKAHVLGKTIGLYLPPADGKLLQRAFYSRCTGKDREFELPGWLGFVQFFAAGAVGFFILFVFRRASSSGSPFFCRGSFFRLQI